MLAILSNNIESAGRLSENLQYYWNTQGVYTSVSLFENDVEFCTALRLHHYKSVILQGTENTLNLVRKIRCIRPDCRIAILGPCGNVKEAEFACICHSLGVEMVLTHSDLEKPLEMLSKQLCIV